MNERLKKALKNYNVKQWQLAKELKVSEFALSRKLREEISETELKYYLKAIKTIASRKEVN